MTTSTALRLLIVEDDIVDRKLLGRLLDRSSLELSDVQCVERLSVALKRMAETPFDLVLLDLGLPDSQGLDSFLAFRAACPDVPVIVVTGLDDETTATRAVQQGVQDYLVKGQMDSGLLMRSIQYALERKRAERALQVAEQRYRTIFENSAVAIMMVDPAERLISWNTFTEQLLAMTEADLLGRDIASLYPESEWRRVRATSRRHKGMHRLETKMIRKDGDVIDVDVSLSVLRDSDGGVAGTIGVVRDITERMRVHEILDRKQKNLEAIFDAAPFGMLLVNADGLVVRANDAIRQMSGKSYRDIINHYPCEALACRRYDRSSTPCQRCVLETLIQTTLEAGVPVHGVETQPVLDDNGEEARPWLSLSAEPVNIDGAKHVFLALNDVTDRKHAESQLRETMELRSQFISTVSHELRTPLTSMREAVIIVSDGVAGKLNKDQRHFLDIARRNIDRLARLIDDVLDFQKLSAGKMAFAMRPNRVDRTVEDAYQTMKPHAEKKRVHLSMHLDPDLPPVACDSDKIVQVLTNLISNAIKFTPEGGTVSISAQRREEYLAIQVSDTGLGIPKEALPKIFNQFYRVRRPGREIKGTGLGLAIVYKIVAGHGGRIEVTSEVDKGTTFTVVLPWAAAQPLDGASERIDEDLEHTLAPEQRR